MKTKCSRCGLLCASRKNARLFNLTPGRRVQTPALKQDNSNSFNNIDLNCGLKVCLNELLMCNLIFNGFVENK